jgi:DNA-binding transcriptional regulator YbjK
MPIEEYRKSVADQKRQAILDAAVRNFLATGYERTTLETVAKDAGVSTATVYKERELNNTSNFLAVRVWQCQTPRQKLHLI